MLFYKASGFNYVSVLYSVSLLFFINSNAQSFPTNPEPGKYYVRCTTPDVYETEEIKKRGSPFDAGFYLSNFNSNFKDFD